MIQQPTYNSLFDDQRLGYRWKGKRDVMTSVFVRSVPFWNLKGWRKCKFPPSTLPSFSVTNSEGYSGKKIGTTGKTTDFKSNVNNLEVVGRTLLLPYRFIQCLWSQHYRNTTTRYRSEINGGLKCYTLSLFRTHKFGETSPETRIVDICGELTWVRPVHVDRGSRIQYVCLQMVTRSYMNKYTERLT